MRTLTVLAALVMLLTGRLTVAHAGEGGDQDRIQGSWSVSTGEKAGREAPAEGLKGVRVAFAGGKFTWKTGANETKGTFSLDATKTPREISMSAEGKTLAGVYRLEGDDLAQVGGQASKEGKVGNPVSPSSSPPERPSSLNLPDIPTEMLGC